MPDALLRACAGPCRGRNLTRGGLCDECSRAREQRRGTAAARGYDSYWQRWRLWWLRRLIAFGLAPVCGARWPGAPATSDSQCGERLVGIRPGDWHLDHTPPLTAGERSVRTIVCDPMRVQLLCATCHTAKTQREQR